ncbi:hypothetical protein [Paracoccus sp. SSK6]|uniref:hypothetical protein n=1 Tax=Paracoccus sp. SSK6 TaxID=3143131 RepID=UPI003219D0FD
MPHPDDDNPVAAAILLGIILLFCGWLVGSFAVEITIHQIDGARAAAAQAERNEAPE